MQTLDKVKKLQQTVNYLKKIIVIDLDKEVEGVESLNSFIGYKDDAISNFLNFKPIDFDCNKQVAYVLCSSGTTGFPKGVMVTHKNLVYRFAQSMEPQFNFISQPDSTLLNFLPLFHAIGLYGCLEALLLGYRIVIKKNYKPNLFLRSIQNYKVSHFRTTPSILVFLAKSSLCYQYDLSSLKYVLCGASSLSKEVEDTITNRFGWTLMVRQGYGLTEATFAATTVPNKEPKSGSSGTVIPHYAVKVVDRKTGESLGANKNGELYVKGPLITKGYINNMQATKECFLADGWLRTGDIGYYDEEYHFFIIDRIKDLIKYKGFQIASAEIEAILLQHPKITQAGVCGLPDDRAGELPVAFVVKKIGEALSEKEVIQFVAHRISRNKNLHGGVYFVDDLPKLQSGKILRRKLREWIVKKFSKL